MRFNASKCVLIRFGPEISPHSYFVHGDPVSLCTLYKNLGVLLTSDLSWSSHIASILAKAYRSLGLIKRVVPYSSSVDLKRSLYLSLVRCHLSYCSPVWRPRSLQDIRKIESLQRRATKYITSYHLNYKSRLKATNLLPMSLWPEAQDVMLLIKLMLDPPSGFRLEEYITYMSSSTRASSLNKIKSSRLLTPRLNITRHFFFNRVIRIWNSLPYIDIQLPYSSIKRHILSIFWKYFLQSYSIDNPCSRCIACPCANCSKLPNPSLNLTTLSST